MSRAATKEGQRQLRRVLREFGGPEGRMYQPGEVVDVTTWRNAHRLVEQRKISDYIVAE